MKYVRNFDFDTEINRLNTNSIKWDIYPSDTIPLWIADCDFKAPEPVLRALRQKLDHGVLGYERISRHLQETIAERMERLYSWKISPESVIGVPGVLGGIYLSTRVFCQPGNGIILETPCYPPFLRIHHVNSLKLKLAPLLSEVEGNILSYSSNWDCIEDLFKYGKTDMFLLCSPHNPTGITYSKQELLRLADLCLKNETIICADEVFGEMLMGDARHTPIASLDKDIESQTITFIGAAKQYNIPGLMLAFVIITNEKLRKDFEALMVREAVRINSFGITASEVAYSQECDEWLAQLLAYLRSNRDALINMLADRLPEVSITRQDASYLSWLDFSTLKHKWSSHASPSKYLLDHAKVGLFDGSEFGPGYNSYTRFNTGCTRATLEESVRRIVRALK